MKCRSIAAAAISCLLMNSVGHAQTYKLTLLSPPSGFKSGGNGSWPFAINDAGTVVGYSFNGGGTSYQATLWNSSVGQALAASSAPYSAATAINGSGVAVGYVSIPSVAVQATAWVGTSGTSVGSSLSMANGINSSGQIVGYSAAPGGNAQAVVWNSGVPTVLTPLTDYPSSVARSINDAGQIAGTSNTTTGTTIATVWSGAQATALALLPGFTSSNASAINSSGQVAGNSTTAETDLLPISNVATLWSEGHAMALQPIFGYANSDARGMNDDGWIVGSSYDPTTGFAQQATLWEGTTPINLNTLLTDDAAKQGWLLWNATAINNKGWIVGAAVKDDFSSSAAFLLIPVPEPEIYAMILVGLVLLKLALSRNLLKWSS